ncbi:murein hydrolase activator EnvC family protein [Aeromicrobium duanguangcaii]|uniref:M23 family metallopeptidase n=1 Tax=Aeromicrobium duanguangcaii TaxID=2968086 RepID=A0ABY5KJU7_9ACTN|nr:M23 family metallopeptidase [Aeromicrobium duanguangcaii]MCD9153379.1 M23 family metallopeptidase [Aeromicrobium duanguangcaii]UUI70029.1 M23 family metallopeptidase [Aeromicrobium duanguangcaii]
MSSRDSGRRRRAVSGLFPVWAWGFLAAVVSGLLPSVPYAVAGPFTLLFFALALVRPPHQDDRDPVHVASPVRGRWTVVHSPASAVPSHGVRAYGQSHAVDIIHPRPEGTKPSYPLLGGFERPERFSSFGEPILAVADGTVVRVLDGRRDHLSRTSWLAFAYMMVIDGVRDLGGPGAVIGNHVVIDHGDGVHSLYAHVRRGTAAVGVGDQVAAGEVVGTVGNSGNTSEPHLHFQLMDRAQPLRAAGLPMRFDGLTQTPGAVDHGWDKKPPATDIEPGLPANFQVFEA